MQRIDVRLMVAVGVALFSISAFMNSKLTYQTGYDQLIWSQLVRAMGQPLIMVPLTSIATAGLPPKEAGSASGLFNMMRNLGGSMGIAALATLLTNREQFHSNRLGESVSSFNPETQERINQLTQYFASRGSDLDTARDQAIKSIDNVVRRESFVMAFNDCFYFIAIALLMSGIAILFFKKVKPGAGSVVGH
jgi:MFS transporter, DHA2 family, multidrug resistance protein